jgi:hypothetical protein
MFSHQRYKGTLPKPGVVTHSLKSADRSAPLDSADIGG